MRASIRNLIVLLCGLASLTALADEYWLLQRLDTTGLPDGTAQLQAQFLGGGPVLTAPCHLLRQGAESWIAGRLELEEAGDYRVQLVVTPPTGPPIERELYAARRFAPQRYDVALLIDTSKSMNSNDPDDLRAAAIRRFVELARQSHAIRRLSLIAFDDRANVILPPTAPAELTDLEPYLRKLRPSGRTNFDEPFAEARGLLSANANEAQPAVVFLSDGEPFGRYREGHRRLAAIGCPIYAIGLSEDSDQALLGRIADETRGRFFSAPEAAQLPRIFGDIFHLISPPVVVQRRELTVKGESELPLVIDPTMRNPVLEWTSRDGQQTMQLPGEAPRQIADTTTISQTLEKLAPGQHVLKVTGNGRANLTVLADTPLQLTPILLNADAEQGLPITAYLLLRGQRLCRDVVVKADILLPDGQTQAVGATVLGDGLYALAPVQTSLPGSYTLRLEVSGAVEGSAFQRLLSLHAHRQRQAAAIGSLASPETSLLLPAPTLPTPQSLDLSATGSRQTETPGAHTTFWASSEAIELNDLWPGTTGTREVTVMVNSLGDAQPSATLLLPPTPDLTASLSGQLELNRKSTLVLRATADQSAAGTHHDATVEVRLGAQHWAIPVTIAVGVPALVVEQQPPTITDTPLWVEARQTMQVRLEPGGSVPIQVTSTLAGLEISPSELLPGDSPATVNLRLRLARPTAQRLWKGELRFTGPGLKPVALPYELSIQERPGPVTARELKASMIDWRLILWCLLAAALIVLLLALLKGKRRVSFIMISAVIHLLLLFLVIPKQDRKTSGPPEVTTIQLTSGAVVHEQQIASETAEFSPSESTAAEAAEATPESAELPEPEPETPEALTGAEVQEPVDAQPAPTETKTEVTRDELTPEVTEAVANAPTKRAETQPEKPPSDVPETTALPQATVARSVSTSAMQLDTREWHESVQAQPITAPAREAIERELMKPEAVEAEPTQQAKRAEAMQAEATEAPATAAASSGPAAQVERRDLVEPGELASGAPAQTASTEAQPTALAGATASVTRSAMQVSTPTEAATGPAKRAAALPASSGSSGPQQSEAGPASAATHASLSAAPTGSNLPAQTASSLSPAASLTGTPGGVSRPVVQPTATGAASGSLSQPALRAETGSGGAGAAPLAAAPRLATTGKTSGQGTGEPATLQLPPGSTALPAAPAGTLRAPAFATHGVAPAALSPKALTGSPAARPGSRASGSGESTSASGGGPVAKGTGTLVAQGPAPSGTSNALPLPQAAPELMAVAGGLLQPPRIGLASANGQGDEAGKWGRTLPLLQYNGDWDSDKTAMINLAHQLEERTGSALPLRSQTLEVSNPNLDKVPFLFMTGHRDFQLRAEEQRELHDYLLGGGSLWINDSTDLGNDVYDAAVRREVAKLLPNAEFRRIPMEHPLFAAPYDLTHGYKGYRVPPGDKYRLDYLEGIWLNGRLAVIYTRNDYGDGLEIDPHTHPLMPSLSDLSPAEMQEGAVRMGINISLYFMNRGQAPRAAVIRQVRSTASEAEENRSAWTQKTPVQATLLRPTINWQAPEGWEDTLDVSATFLPEGQLQVTFSKASGAITRRDKVVIGAPLGVALQAGYGLAMEVRSELSGGARLALAFNGPSGYLESAPQFIRPGLNESVGFDLGAQTFKNAETEWAYTAPFGDSRQIDQWFLILYPQQAAGTITIDNVRLIQR